MGGQGGVRGGQGKSQGWLRRSGVVKGVRGG